MPRTSLSKIALGFTLSLVAASLSEAAPPDRVRSRVDVTRTRVLKGNLHRQVQPQFDQGAVDPSMHMDYMVLVFKPSPEQQSDLDTLLADQQNPGSAAYHQWLTPEQYANRFGLSSGDHSKVVAWLTSQGFTVNQSARGRNWVAFSGSAGQVSTSMHTSIHRYQVDGESHFANSSEPSVPEALADVMAGFIGLHDFLPHSFAQRAQLQPHFTSGTAHYLAPEDYATIYNIAPLYKAGFDGTGQNIAVVGQSGVLLSDLRAFRTQFNLPANDPKMILYSSTDPGINGAQGEANLDLEWAGAIAPKATISYIYGPNAFTAIISAINLNLAPVISSSWGSCEVDNAQSFYRSIAQQGNAQGITILNASGDSGAAACDAQGSAALAAHGRSVAFPAVMPEVTGVGGTQFSEGSGAYWGTSNSANQGSALSYIPEAAWNESGPGGLISSGGGASVSYARPAWQTGPGVPNDDVRHVPDVSLSAAGHDAYLTVSQGQLGAFFGTSASAPAMAGVVALLNQYQVSKGFQKLPGVGNINPQLYRLAQSAPSAFHEVAAGNNIVPCAQGSPDCLSGSFGYPSAQGYDMATGLGSVDANNLVTLWNTASQPVTVVLSLSSTRVTPSDTVGLTAGVFPVNGGTPTGTISFSSGTTPLGSAPLVVRNGQQVADVFFPAYKLQGTGVFLVSAEYSGDAAFSSGGATRTIQIVVTAGTAAIIPSWPNTIWPSRPDAQGLSWQTSFSLVEVAGVPAIITNFSIDGVAQPVSTCFATPNIQASSAVTCTLVSRKLAAPLTRTFGISGVDAGGTPWSREFSINYNPLPPGDSFILTATPLVISQNPAADPSCQWSTQINVDDFGGALRLISSLTAGNVNLTANVPAIFGTDRVAAYGSLAGTLCFGDITPPATNLVSVTLSNGLTQELNVSFVAPAASPSKISASPESISLVAVSASQPATATLSVGITDKSQPWTASITPANTTTSWLSLSQYSGTGPGQLVLTASAAGFGPGAYRAIVTIQSANSVPQYINVPVMFVLGPNTSGTKITSVANPASYQSTGSPGMLLSVFGANLANSTATATVSPLGYSTAGVSATVNGSVAPILYASPGQLNILIPYETGSGPAVLGINNNGQVAGFQFQVAASAPGVFADSNGDIIPNATVKRGAVGTLLLTGAGEISPALKTAFGPASVAAAAAYRPLLPISVTVGGVPAFVQSASLTFNQFGVTQVNFLVPGSVPTGRQPVVVTIGGVSSPAVNVTVQAASGSSSALTDGER